MEQAKKERSEERVWEKVDQTLKCTAVSFGKGKSTTLANKISYQQEVFYHSLK